MVIKQICLLTPLVMFLKSTIRAMLPQQLMLVLLIFTMTTTLDSQAIHLPLPLGLIENLQHTSNFTLPHLDTV